MLIFQKILFQLKSHLNTVEKKISLTSPDLGVPSGPAHLLGQGGVLLGDVTLEGVGVQQLAGVIELVLLDLADVVGLVVDQHAVGVGHADGPADYGELAQAREVAVVLAHQSEGTVYYNNSVINTTNFSPQTIVTTHLMAWK